MEEMMEDGPLAYSHEPEISEAKQKLRLERLEKRKLLPKAQKQSKRVNNIDWCRCTRCVPMTTEIESNCCMKMEDGSVTNPLGYAKCITEDDHFNAAILNSLHYPLYVYHTGRIFIMINMILCGYIS